MATTTQETSRPVTGAAPPVVTATPESVASGASIALSSLFTVTTTTSPVNFYLIYDPAAGGHINLNGATNLLSDYESFGYYEVSASDLGKVQYVGGSSAGAEYVSLRAYDGNFNSAVANALVTTTKTPETTAPAPSTTAATGPVLVPAAGSVALGNSIALTSLFTATDASGTIADLIIYDHGEHNTVNLNGAVNLLNAEQQAKGYYEVSLADAAKVTITAVSNGTETLRISASDDGTHFTKAVNVTLKVGTGELDHVTTTPTTTTPPSTVASSPVVTGSTQTLAAGGSLSLGTVFTATDTGASIVKYLIHDPAGGGHFDLNGAANILPGYETQGYYEVSVADIGKVLYVAGSKGGSEFVSVRAYDSNNHTGETSILIKTTGTDAPTTTHTDTPPAATGPVLTTISSKIVVGQSVALNSLFTATDAHATIADYRFFDDSTHSKVQLNGAVNLFNAELQTKGYYEVSADDMAKVTILETSTGNSNIAISASENGTSWSPAVTITVVGVETSVTSTVSTSHEQH